MLRVAVVTQYCPTSKQPWAGHSAYQTLRLLAHKVELAVFYPEVQYVGPAKPKASGLPLDPAWSPPDLKIHYIPYPAIPVLSRPVNGLAMAWKLLPHVRAFQPDLVLNYVVYPDGFAAVRIAQALGCPAVLTAIGSDLNRISDRLTGVMTRYALRHAAFVTTVSRDLAATAQRLGSRPETTRAILNGCDTTVFYPQDRNAARQALGIADDVEAVVYAGRLDVRKGLLELIGAVAELRAKRPRLQCYIVGDGPDRPLLVAAIAQLGVADAVRLEPSCLTAQIAQWMAAADLVTLPSYKEGCPNVVIEALSSGRPVVATNVGGIPELMDDRSGRLVAAKDVNALAQALDDVLKQQWDADALAALNSRSWQEVADELLDVMQATAGKA
jgi:glycosyltransferase involved in cell wall biosynthesis